jgi:hypothetical protein
MEADAGSTNATPVGYRWIAAVIILVAFALRAWDLQGQSLFCDEAIEASIAMQPIDQIVDYPDGFPPLYHLLLAGWLRVFAVPESARWLSVIAGTLTVYGLFRWTEQSVGPRAAVFAAGLLAISPLHVFFSQEMRAYVLYLCLATFTLRYFFEALATNSIRSWTCFALIASLTNNTHYYGGLLTALLGLVLLYYRRDWRRIQRGIGSFAAIAVLSTPALVLLSGDLGYQSEGYTAKASVLPTLAHTGYSFFLGYSIGPSVSELHHLPLKQVLTEAAPWVALIAIAASRLLWHGWRELCTRPYGGAIAWLALTSAPIIALAGELAGVGGKVRYWSWVLMPILVWLGAGAASGWRGRGSLATRAALGVIVAVQLLATVNRYGDPRYANEDLRSVAAYLEKQAPPSAPIVCVADYMAQTLRMYLNGSETLVSWLQDDYQGGAGNEPRGRIILPRTQEGTRGSAPFDPAAVEKWQGEIASLAGPDGRFWLVYTREFHGDPGGLLLKELTRRGLIERERDFAGAVLYRGRVE